MDNSQDKINQYLDKPEKHLKRQEFFTGAVNELRKVKSRMNLVESKNSTIRDEVKTENLVTDDTGFDFKIEKITVGFKTQRRSTKKPPI